MRRRIEQVKEQAAATALARHVEARVETNDVESVMMLGAVGAMKTLSDNLSAQTMRALEAFGESKGYEALGFSTFAEFLDKSPYSPMSKNQYYDRKQALEAEGDATYNLLNSLRVPISARKLLKGQVSVEGEKLIIGQNDDEQVIPLNDSARIAEVIKSFAKKNAEQERTIERGKTEVTKLKKKLDAAKRSGATAGSPFDQALLTLLGAFSSLITEVENLSEEEREEKLSVVLQQIAGQRLRLEEAFGFDSRKNGNHKLPLSTETLDSLTDSL